MATITPPANVSSLVSRFEKPESRNETRSETPRSEDPKFSGGRYRSKKVRPPLIRLEFVTAQTEPKPVQARLRMFESPKNEPTLDLNGLNGQTRQQLPFRKNESVHNVRSRTTLERPLLKLKSKFEKNHSLSPMRKSHGNDLNEISLSSSSLTMSPSRSMPDVTKSEEVSLPFPRIRTSYGENSIPADFHHREAFVTRMNRTRPDSLDRVSNPESSRARKSGMLAPPMSAKSARRSKHEKFDQSGWSPSPLPSFRNNF